MLKKLRLQDFRNYADRTFDFETKSAVFFGENGAGKTNVLESIWCVATARSWRDSGANLIRQNAESAKVSAEIEGDNYEFLAHSDGRQIIKNGKPRTIKSHSGQILTLLFVPEDLGLFAGNKAGRQRYFDRYLAPIFPVYRQSLIALHRANREKTHLLKNAFGADTDAQVASWNAVLAKNMPEIYRVRRDFLAVFNPILDSELAKISGKSESAEIKLKKAEDFGETEPEILEFLAQNQSRERQTCRNLANVFRDDFAVQFRGQPILASASRGEQRSVILAILAAKKKFLQSQKSKNATVILLLDDVFSELDASRQAHLQAICDGTQTFLTTTHCDHFASFSDLQSFEISKK